MSCSYHTDRPDLSWPVYKFRDVLNASTCLEACYCLRAIRRRKFPDIHIALRNRDMIGFRRVVRYAVALWEFPLTWPKNNTATERFSFNQDSRVTFPEVQLSIANAWRAIAENSPGASGIYARWCGLRRYWNLWGSSKFLSITPNEIDRQRCLKKH